eukprot:scaffold12059_cov19-Tisochrysis_lutea.AAC.2
MTLTPSATPSSNCQARSHQRSLVCTPTRTSPSAPSRCVQQAVVTILDTMPKGGGGGSGLSREEIVDKICEELLSKVRCS